MTRISNDRAAGANEKTSIQIGSRLNEKFIVNKLPLRNGLARALPLHFVAHLLKRLGNR
jgi:hypothetical protein